MKDVYQEVLRMKRALFILPAMAMLAMLAVSCGKKEEGLKVDEGVAARIGNMKITDKEIDEKFELLAENQKSQYRGPGGRAKFVDMLINDELFYLEAKNKNLKNSEKVRTEMEALERRVLIGAYYSEYIAGKVAISDKDIELYYKNNQDEFYTNSLYKAQHIFSVDSMKCVQWKKRIENGEKFSAIAKGESEDESTAPAYGNLGYFNPGGFIKFIGTSKSFSDAVEALTTGDISDVIKHEKGYSLVMVNDMKPAALKPLEDVRQTIIEKLQKESASEILNVEIDNLRKKYKPENLARQEVLNTTRTAEQLWQIAQAEDAAYTRILYFRELVARYPQHKLAPQALFMIGFVYSEELDDLVQARKAFDELIKNYSGSDMVESAKWMIENLNNPRDKLESMESVIDKAKKDGK